MSRVDTSCGCTIGDNFDAPCTRQATQEDLLCDVCRPTADGPHLHAVLLADEPGGRTAHVAVSSFAWHGTPLATT